MKTDFPKPKKANATFTAEKGMIIYRGVKETDVEAIRRNSFEITAIIKDGTGFLVHLENLSDHRFEPVRLHELFSRGKEKGSLLLFANDFEALVQRLNNESNPLPIIPSSAIPKELIQKADEIILKIKSVDLLTGELEKKYKADGVTKTYRTLLEEACEIINSQSLFTTGIHPSSYYDFKKRYKKYHYDRLQLASSLHRSSFNQTRFDKTTLSFTDTMILEFSAGDENRYKSETVYSKLMKDVLERTGNRWVDPDKCDNKVPQDLVEELLNPRIPFQNILNNPEKAALLSFIKRPSRSWFYNYVRWFKANPDLSEKEIRERYGDEFYEKTILVFDTYVKLASYPLHYVFADHCLLDIYIVDEETRSEPYKVWLTVLIDAYSRCILGIALLDEPPCIESIQTALKHAIWRKEDWLEENGLTVSKPWECFGYPINLSFDNAWAHHSHSMENLITRLSYDGNYTKIILVFHPPYKGRYGALIERFFGNLQAQIKATLLGAQKDREFKSIQNAKREACLLYSDLLQAIVKLIVEYMHQPHSELDGLTPTQKWIEGMGAHFPVVPDPDNEEINRFFWRGYPDTRVIGKEGISLFDMKYWSPGLAKQRGVDWDKKKVEYSISYNVDDVSTLAVFLNNRWVCDVHPKQLQVGSETWLKISLTEMNLAKRISKERFGTTTNWLECAYEFEELNEKRTKEKKAAKRKQHRANLAKSEGQQTPLTDKPANQTNDELTLKVANFVKRSKKNSNGNG